MKAWALWQPWASLWLGVKLHETRDYSLHHRGWLLVHATKHIEHELEPQLADIVESEFGPHWGLDLPRGALIGAVNIIACKPTRAVFPLGHAELTDPDEVRDDFICGNFGAGRFAIERAPEVKVFRKPIPVRGQQAPFDVPDELVREALATAAPSLREARAA
jgi:hypothetical protein